MSSVNFRHEAIQRCQTLFERAKTLNVKEPMAVSLATVDPLGQPSVRMVLVRGFDQRGFVFYTNGDSRKGRELTHNPRAALCFYWDEIREQIRVEGSVTQIADEESDAYWVSRPRLSQLAAVASKQSQVLQDRQDLADQVAELDRKYGNRSVPRPDYWFGYRLVPHRIEFWTGREGRMHERTVYEESEQEWISYLVYP